MAETAEIPRETAYKMFNKDLTCTLGKGKFQYEPGIWYEEETSDCRKTGFHSAKNPLDCLNYYGNWDNSACWLVEVGGTVDEDDCDSKISSTKIRLKRPLNLLEFVLAASNYIIDHPQLPNNHRVAVETGEAGSSHFIICRGKHPKARGGEGDILAILQEWEDSPEIKSAGLWIVSAKGNHKPGVWYDQEGQET